jgi:hypothetical protein
MPEPGFLYEDQHAFIRYCGGYVRKVALVGREAGMMPGHYSEYPSLRAAKDAYMAMLVRQVAHLNDFINLERERARRSRERLRETLAEQIQKQW